MGWDCMYMTLGIAHPRLFFSNIQANTSVCDACCEV
jgi:hypothetical protein